MSLSELSVSQLASTCLRFSTRLIDSQLYRICLTIFVRKIVSKLLQFYYRRKMNRLEEIVYKVYLLE